MTDAIVVILSGGIDSTVLTYDLVHQGYSVNAISFNYGQKHSIELYTAARTCRKLGIPQKTVWIETIKELMYSPVLTGDDEVPEGHYEDASMKSTVVANRNSILINLAMAYAITENISTIAYGAHAGDHFIYPDCRPIFVERIQALAEVVHYTPLKIVAPFLHMNKKDIVKRGVELGVNFRDTWSCYKGGKIHCGKCGTCTERIEAFKLNNYKDPLEYEIDIDWEK